MATATFLPLAEYLETNYRPDREYIDGELRERNVGKWDHARVQGLLGLYIGKQEAAWGVMFSTEQRIRVAEKRIRIPDVTILTEQYPPDVLVDPPLVVIEVLSEGDSYAQTQAEAEDYFRMGVGTVWIVDPMTETARQNKGGQWVETRLLSVPNSPVEVRIEEIFAQWKASKR